MSPDAAADPAREPQLAGRVQSFALALAYAGLLPFVAGAALIWIVRADAHVHVGSALSAYAALIVSFLGGIHWGLAMRSPDPRRVALRLGRRAAPGRMDRGADALPTQHSSSMA